MSDKDLENFCQKYDATVELSKKYFQRMAPVRWDDSKVTAYNMYMETYRERCVEITLPEDRFRTLISFETELARYRLDRDAVESMINDRRRELFLRTKNPAVQKAYEHYKLLLAMTESEFPDARY